MEFEVFTGEHGRKFYVYGQGYNFRDVQKELAKRTKSRAEEFNCYTGYVERGDDGEDILRFEAGRGAEQVLVAVKGRV